MMPCTHEFSILDEFDKTKEYNDYDPHKRNCIAVDDDVLHDLMPDLLRMKTYFHTYKRPGYGLAYTGITLIPPESLPMFYDLVLTSNQTGQLRQLAATILRAIEQNKWMIHYGL